MDIMIASITSSTLRQYKSALRLWISFAVKHNLDALHTSTTAILFFLTQIFKNGANYGILNTNRLAISIISLHNIFENGLITRFFKDIYKKKPSRPKYATTWDISPVLIYLEKLHPLS